MIIYPSCGGASPYPSPPRKTGWKGAIFILFIMTGDNIKGAIALAAEIMFTKDTGVIPLFLAFLGAYPILLLPMGFYLVILGVKSARKLTTGY